MENLISGLLIVWIMIKWFLIVAGFIATVIVILAFFLVPYTESSEPDPEEYDVKDYAEDEDEVIFRGRY